jgi:hypothetical protein
MIAAQTNTPNAAAIVTSMRVKARRRKESPRCTDEKIFMNRMRCLAPLKGIRNSIEFNTANVLPCQSR